MIFHLEFFRGTKQADTHQRPNMLPTASSLTDRPASSIWVFTYLQTQDKEGVKVYEGTSLQD